MYVNKSRSLPIELQYKHHATKRSTKPSFDYMYVQFDLPVDATRSIDFLRVAARIPLSFEPNLSCVKYVMQLHQMPGPRAAWVYPSRSLLLRAATISEYDR